jgi:hypothetical protein
VRRAGPGVGCGPAHRSWASTTRPSVFGGASLTRRHRVAHDRASRSSRQGIALLTTGHRVAQSRDTLGQQQGIAMPTPEPWQGGSMASHGPREGFARSTRRHRVSHEQACRGLREGRTWVTSRLHMAYDKALHGSRVGMHRPSRWLRSETGEQREDHLPTTRGDRVGQASPSSRPRDAHSRATACLRANVAILSRESSDHLA